MGMLGRTCLSAASSRLEGAAVAFLTIFCSLASLNDGQTEGVLATTAAPLASEGCYDTQRALCRMQTFETIGTGSTCFITSHLIPSHLDRLGGLDLCLKTPQYVSPKNSKPLENHEQQQSI